MQSRGQKRLRNSPNPQPRPGLGPPDCFPRGPKQNNHAGNTGKPTYASDTSIIFTSQYDLDWPARFVNMNQALSYRLSHVFFFKNIYFLKYRGGSLKAYLVRVGMCLALHMYVDFLPPHGDVSQLCLFQLHKAKGIRLGASNRKAICNVFCCLRCGSFRHFISSAVLHSDGLFSMDTDQKIKMWPLSGPFGLKPRPSPKSQSLPGTLAALTFFLISFLKSKIAL